MTKLIIFDKKEHVINNVKFILDWESSVVTEKKTFLYLKNNQIKLPLDYIAFPWAFLLDIYCNKFNLFFSDFYDFIKNLGLLDLIKPNSNYITTVQSYHLEKFLDTFNKIGIKYIFYPHSKERKFLKTFYTYNIILIPYLIYPSIKGKILNKSIFYSFIGNINYNNKYTSDIRKKICNMKHSENCYIKAINKWHFDDNVYGNQFKLIKYDKENYKKNMNLREENYKTILGKSLFSICPLGIGPNSIRLSESLIFNSIPVSISDDLWFPFYLDIDWEKIIIKMEESKIDELLTLENLSFHEPDIINYQKNIYDFSNNFLSENNYGNQVEIFFKPKNSYVLLIPWYNITDKLRYEEIHTCLENNLQNKLIKKIIFFYECEDKSQIKYSTYQHEKISIIPIITNKKRDVNFNQIIDYCNKYLINEMCIISNNDIYFDKTLGNLIDLDFINSNYFVSLTRKNCEAYLDKNNKIWKPHSASQDSWIFKSPIKPMPYHINLGWIQCDNIISHCYHNLGYKVINPHLSVNGWHLHKFNNTLNLLENYNYDYKYKMLKVPLKSIEEIKVEKYININSQNKLNMKKFVNLKKNFIKKTNDIK